MKRNSLLSGVAIAVALIPEAGWAQNTPAPSAQPAQSVDNDANAIVVTAQRRAENTTEVPISLTVRDDENLKQMGISTIRDLHIGTPGLRIDRNGISVQPAIRGVTALDGNPGNDANVAIYVDGVYRPNPAANNIDLPDVQQVEVLKGPQGTLFGRNATGGAIRISTLRPSATTQGAVTLSYGSFNDFVAKGFVTGAIAGEAVTGSLSGYYERNDGYLKDATNNDKATGGLESYLIRSKLLIKPSGNAELLLIGHYSHRRDGSLAGQPFNGNTSARGTPGAIIPTAPYEIANNHDPYVRVNEYSLSADATYHFDFADLNSITAYNYVDQFSPVESDYTNIDSQIFYTSGAQKTFSQELTMASRGSGTFKWLAGAFYYNDDAKYTPLRVVTGGFPFDIYGRQTTKAYSVFGEINYEIVPRLTVIAGLRYSNEKRALSGTFGTFAYPPIASATFQSTTPRVSARYEFEDGTNIYATFSQGFKSGGFSASSLSPTPFRPEKLSAYEVGLKTSSRGSVRVSIAGFYYDYTDQQVQAATTLPNNTTVGTTANAASSKIYGIEAEGALNIGREFSILATASWLHARYSSYLNAFVQVPILVGGVACQCGNVGANINVTGNQLVRAPDYSASVTLNYKHEFEAGTLNASTTFYASGKFFFTPDNRVGQPAYETLAARIAFTTTDKRWTFAAFGKNLTDALIYQGASILPAADGVLFAPPRTLGIEVTRTF